MPPTNFPLGRKPVDTPIGEVGGGDHERQQLEAVGQLAAGIAHEINTPIQFVGHSVTFLDQAFADLTGLVAVYRAALADAEPAVRATIDAAEEAADLAYVEERLPVVFARVYSGVERVSTLVKAMKSFSHSTPPGERSPTDLNEAIQATLTVAHNELKYAAEVVSDLGRLPAVVCNRSDLNQAFLNLFVNAAHAIEDVVGESGDRGTIAVTTRCDGDEVAISVSDDGCGIDPALLSRIYEPFFTTKAVGRGSGQGLAIARAMVERNGGTLECESEPGAGTTFTIRLPLEPAQAREAA